MVKVAALESVVFTYRRGRRMPSRPANFEVSSTHNGEA